MIGLTFGKGALIALERRRQRMKEVFEHALAREQRIVVPADVVAEWWRGRTTLRLGILASVDVEPLTEELAKAAEALAAVKGSTLLDAIVMASAASRGDLVYTSDVEDLERLRTRFPSVRVLGV